MNRIGRILKNRMEKFIFNTIESRFNLNTESKLYAPAGIHCVPLKDDRMLLCKIDGTGKFAVAGTLNVLQAGLDDISEGDIWIFSRDPGSGKYQTWIKLNHDGTLEIDTPSSVTINNHDTVTIDIEGDVKLNCHSKVDAEIDDAVTIQANDKVDITTEKPVTVTSPKVEFKGGQVIKAGSAPPTGTGGWCAIPVCPVTGEIHIGDVLS